jgi:hypothetical protein
MEHGLERLARPWTRLRAMSVFRDESDLTLNPDLWASISRRLDSSRYLVLMLSPESAASPWVNKEAGHWLDARGPDGLLLVWTGGELDWDDTAGDFSESSTALLPVLRGRFDNEPLYLDLRWARQQPDLSLNTPAFRVAVAQVAAPIRGIAPDELVDEDVRLRRRARRLGRAAIVTVAVLAVVAGIAAALAVRNARQADRRAREAVARQVGLAALDMPASELDQALLTTLAAADLASDDDPHRFQSAQVLMGRYSRLQRLLQVSGDDEYVNVRGLAIAADGTILAAAGRSDGTSALARWKSGAPVPDVVDLPAGGGSVVRGVGGSIVIEGGPGASLLVDASAATLASEPIPGSLLADPDAGDVAWARTEDGLVLVSLSGAEVLATAPAEALVDSVPGRAVTLVDGTLTVHRSDGRIEATAGGAPTATVIATGAGDGPALVAATTDGSLATWRIDDDALVPGVNWPLPEAVGAPVALAPAPDGSNVLVVGSEGAALVDLASGAASTSPGGGTTVIDADPSGRFVALGGSRLAVWDLAAGQRVISMPQVVSALAWSGPCDAAPRCRLVAGGSGIDVIDPLAEVQVRLADEVGTQAVAISPDATTVASGGWGPVVAVWSVRPMLDDSSRRALSEEALAVLPAVTAGAGIADAECGSGVRAASPSGEFVVTVESATAVAVLCRSGGSGSRLAAAGLNPAAGEVTAVAVDDAGNVVLGRASGIVEHYPSGEGGFSGGSAIDVRVGGEAIDVTAVAARGDVVVAAVRFPGSAGTPARVIVWRLDTLEPTTFATDFDDVAAVTVVDPSASVVAVAGRDGAGGAVTIQLWDTSTLRRVGRAFSGLTGDVTHLLGTESALVGVDGAGHAFRWEIDRDPSGEVCDIVGRPLTREEWDAAADGALRRYGFQPSCAG